MGNHQRAEDGQRLSMRIGRLERNQSPSEAPHSYLSKSRAERFIARRIAKWLIAGKLLQMLKDSEEIRGDAEYLRVRLEIVPAKRKRWKQNLLLYYPHKSQQSQ